MIEFKEIDGNFDHLDREAAKEKASEKEKETKETILIIVVFSV